MDAGLSKNRWLRLQLKTTFRNTGKKVECPIINYLGSRQSKLSRQAFVCLKFNRCSVQCCVCEILSRPRRCLSEIKNVGGRARLKAYPFGERARADQLAQNLLCARSILAIRATQARAEQNPCQPPWKTASHNAPMQQCKPLLKLTCVDVNGKIS